MTCQKEMFHASICHEHKEIMVLHGASKYILIKRTCLAIGRGSEFEITRFPFDPRQLFEAALLVYDLVLDLKCFPELVRHTDLEI